LSTQGLNLIIQFLSQKMPSLAPRSASIALITVFLVSLSNIYLSLGRSLYLLAHPDDFFYPASLDSALVWLEENATVNDFVLSAIPSGQLITQKTDMRVYLGHPMETLDYNNKSHSVETYFKGHSDSDWLEQTKVRWVFFGPYERALVGGTVFPYAWLKVAYQSAEVTIYRVAP
jgi:hypothetical protein